jgi:nitrogen fixation protein NifU and related proteins
MAALYSPTILDHYRNPRNHGILDPHDVSGEDVNTVCGDLVRIELRIVADTITDIRFSGNGCAISQAAASLLTEQVKGHSLHNIHTFSDANVLAWLDVPLSPSRQTCALLGLHVLRHCIATID